MAILTKQELSASNAISFPDNNSGLITPVILRNYNTSSIDSFAALSGSNSFVGNQVVTGSLTVTGNIIGTVSGTLSNAATASYVRGTTKYYSLSAETHAGLIAGSTLTVAGPNGENQSTLQAQGWNFSFNSFQAIVTRPSSSKATLPLVDVTTHGRNNDIVWSKSPTGINTIAFSTAQIFNTSSLLYTTMSVYTVTPGNAGYASSGTGSITITFGEIQN